MVAQSADAKPRACVCVPALTIMVKMDSAAPIPLICLQDHSFLTWLSCRVLKMAVAASSGTKRRATIQPQASSCMVRSCQKATKEKVTKMLNDCCSTERTFGWEER